MPPTTVEFDDERGVQTAKTAVSVDRGGNIVLSFSDERTGEDLGLTVYLGSNELLNILKHAAEAAEIQKSLQGKKQEIKY